MELRFLSEDDYDILCAWWKWWRFSPPSRDFLPLNGCGGLMLEHNGIPVCAGFIYQNDSMVCIIDFIVSNPNYKEHDRSFLIHSLVNHLTELGRENGYKYAFATMKNESMINTYESVGYKKATKGCTEMIKAL